MNQLGISWFEFNVSDLFVCIHFVFVGSNVLSSNWEYSLIDHRIILKMSVLLLKESFISIRYKLWINWLKDVILQWIPIIVVLVWEQELLDQPDDVGSIVLEFVIFQQGVAMWVSKLIVDDVLAFDLLLQNLDNVHEEHWILFHIPENSLKFEVELFIIHFRIITR